jgi:hypothetical protein
VVAFDKLRAHAERAFGVRMGDEHLLAVIDVAGYDLAARDMKSINEAFVRYMAGLGLSYTPAYVLAASLAAVHISRCWDAEVRITAIKKSYYSSVPVQHKALCRFTPLAKLYLDLASVRSSYLKPVASKIAEFLQTRDEGVLYDVLRLMARSQRLTAAERAAVKRFASALL